LPPWPTRSPSRPPSNPNGDPNLALNVVVAVALEHLVANPGLVVDWRHLVTTSYSSPLAMVAVALVVFPKLALGLSGFETGVAVMPLVRGDPDDPPEHPRGRIHNTRKLLVTAALIMSGFLITSSFATTVLIPHQQFEEVARPAAVPSPTWPTSIWEAASEPPMT
jgi:hypothetical protein